MAHVETMGWGKCHCCGGAVAVKRNRSGLGYYRCDHCGIDMRHHWQRSSDKYLQQFAGAAPADDDAAPAAKRGDSQPAPAARKPAASGLSALFGG